MKHIKDIIAQINHLNNPTTAQYMDRLWPYICYSPKMPLRLQQEQLLAQASVSILDVQDVYFTKQKVKIPVYSWGEGSHSILLTHGWASKGVDYNMLIDKLRQRGDIRIIAFDAPGNGQAEGYLSNLLLYIASVQAVIDRFGAPDICIGHSLGAMANITALSQLNYSPDLLISIAPMVNLKANFVKSMENLQIPQPIQAQFFTDFEQTFAMPVHTFELQKLYQIAPSTAHIVIYDALDSITPAEYLTTFMAQHPPQQAINLPGVGHEKLIRSSESLDKINELISTYLK